MSGEDQQAIDAANVAFWDEACGTVAAAAMGVAGDDARSLAAFDAWYFDKYPSLDRFIRFGTLACKDVLEVGLGFGSVAQRIAENGANYTGLDIAEGPVSGVRNRFNQSGLKGTAIQGSILDAPFPDRSFDEVIAIGCYHHTGDLSRSLAETVRLLRPGGRTVIMVYNASSYVSWLKAPRIAMLGLVSTDPIRLNAQERALFDGDSRGQAPAETVVVSRSVLFSRMLQIMFAEVSVIRTHVIAHRPFQFVPESALNAALGPLVGLNLYAVAKNPLCN